VCWRMVGPVWAVLGPVAVGMPGCGVVTGAGSGCRVAMSGVLMAVPVWPGACRLRRPAVQAVRPDGALWRRLSARRRRPPGGWLRLGAPLCAVRDQAQATAPVTCPGRCRGARRVRDEHLMGPGILAARPGGERPAGPWLRRLNVGQTPGEAVLAKDHLLDGPGRQRAGLSATLGSR
jgi:hypothetical protein